MRELIVIAVLIASCSGSSMSRRQADSLAAKVWREELARIEADYGAMWDAGDDWNMWLRPFVDTLFPMIIQAAIVRHNVNPNKVYLMGYSAGGDGAYRMADLDKPIVVMCNGRTLFNEKTPRNAGFIRRSAEERADPDYIFSARLEVTPDGVMKTPAPTYQ